VSRLTFTPGNHSYWLADPDTGRKERLTSVTTLLGQVAKPQLVKWAARAAAEYAGDHWDDLAAMPPSERVRRITAAPDQARNTAAARGTAIHAWAEDLLAGRPVDIPEEHVSTVQGFARWWERSKFTAVASERRVWSEASEYGGCGYAGTFDLLAEHPDYGATLIDHKSGSGVWPEMGVQLAAYAEAEWHVVDGEDRPAAQVESLAITHIRPDGTALHLLDRDERRIAVERFSVLRMLREAQLPTFRQVL